MKQQQQQQQGSGAGPAEHEPDGALKAGKAAVCGWALQISHLNIRQRVCSSVLHGMLGAARALQTLSPLWKTLLFPADESDFNPTRRPRRTTACWEEDPGKGEELVPIRPELLLRTFNQLEDRGLPAGQPLTGL